MTLSKLLLLYARKGPVKALRKSAYRKFCRRNKGREFVVDTKYGARMKLVIGDRVDNDIYVKGEFEPSVSSIVTLLAQESDCFVDVGCNIGYYSCLFGKLNEGASVYAIEPNPEVLIRTKENLGLNGIKNAFTYNAGVSSKPGTLKLYVHSGRHSLSSFAYQPRHGEKGKIKEYEVQVDKLMNIVPPSSIHGAFLKVDTEGYEQKVFAGISPEQAKQFNYVIFELSSENLTKAGVSVDSLFVIPWFSQYIPYLIGDDGHLSKFVPAPTKSYDANILLIRRNLKLTLPAYLFNK